MGTENTSFDAGVIAAVASILGVAYLFGAMLTYLDPSLEFMLLLNVPVTATVGVLLALAAGLLATGHHIGRIIGTTGFGAVVIFGGLSLAESMEPLLATSAGISLILAVYMLLRNPVKSSGRSTIDESTSASRVGSTLR